MSLTKVSYSMIEGAPINVKDFGAIGNGVADDSAAIQAACAALVDGSGLYFPPGEYFITEGNEIDKSNITILGYGATIKYTASLTNLITIPTISNVACAFTFYNGATRNIVSGVAQPTTGTLENIEIRGLRFDRPGNFSTGYANPNTCALYFVGVDGCVVADCIFDNGDVEAILTDAYFANFSIVNNIVRNQGASFFGPVVAVNGVLSNNQLYKCQRLGEMSAYNVIVSGNTFINDPTDVSSSPAVKIGSTSLNQIVKISVQGNRFSGSFTSFISLDTTGGGSNLFKNVDILDNVFDGGYNTFSALVEGFINGPTSPQNMIINVKGNRFDSSLQNAGGLGFIRYNTFASAINVRWNITGNKFVVWNSNLPSIVQIHKNNGAQMFTDNKIIFSGGSLSYTSSSNYSDPEWWRGVLNINNVLDPSSISVYNNTIEGESAMYISPSRVSATTEFSFVDADTVLFENTTIGQQVTKIWTNRAFTLYNAGTQSITIVHNSAKIITLTGTNLTLAAGSAATFIPIVISAASMIVKQIV